MDLGRRWPIRNLRLGKTGSLNGIDISARHGSTLPRGGWTGKSGILRSQISQIRPAGSVETFLELAGVLCFALLVSVPPNVCDLGDLVPDAGDLFYSVASIGYYFGVIPVLANSLYHRAIKRRIEALRQTIPESSAQLMALNRVRRYRDWT
jgi:hypothetical protein